MPSDSGTITAPATDTEKHQRKVVDLGGIFSDLCSFLVARLVLRPWHRLRDALVVTAYWTLDYFSDLLFWSLQLLSSMPGSSSHDEEQVDMAASTSMSTSSNQLSLDSSAMTSSPSDQMDVTLVSPVSESSETDRKWEMSSSASTASVAAYPSGRRNLKLVISPPESPVDPHIDRNDHEHCLQSPFSEELRSGASIDDFHASLMNTVSSELIEASSSFLREDLRIASHSPLNFSLSRGEIGSEYSPSPSSVSIGGTFGSSHSIGGSVPPSPPTASPQRPTQVRRPASARSLSVGTLSHEDKENIAPPADSPSTPPDGSPRIRRVGLRRGYTSFRSPR